MSVRHDGRARRRPFSPVVSVSRISSRLALCALPLLVVATTAPAADAATRKAADVSVSRGACTTSPTDAQARSATFVVRMKARADASSYGFLPQLEERLPGGTWTALKGPDAPAGLAAFKSARRGSQRMVRRINVRGLRSGSAYRLRVEGRYLRGTTQRSTTVLSASCTVKDVRPNVALTGVFGWQPSTAGGEVAYRIGVRATAAESLAATDVPILLRQGETTLASGSFPATAEGYVLLSGKRCVQGQPVVVTLDPDDVIDDREPTDDILRAECVPVQN
jgi:hypothetical protein